MTDHEFQHETLRLLRQIAEQNALLLAHMPFVREGISQTHTTLQEGFHKMSQETEAIRASIGQIGTDVGKISADISVIADKLANGVSQADAAQLAADLKTGVDALDAATTALDNVANPPQA